MSHEADVQNFLERAKKHAIAASTLADEMTHKIMSGEERERAAAAHASAAIAAAAVVDAVTDAMCVEDDVMSA